MSANVIAGMAVEIAGDGAPVICVHGLGGTSNTFTPQMPALATMRAIRPDLPCSGRSANTERPSIASFAASLIKLADTLGVKSAHFVGHSLGTIVCQHLAAERPELVRSLALIGALIEVSLFAYLGRLVDLIKDSASPATFFEDHGTLLIWMGFVAVIARPLVFGLHDVLKNQAIAGSFTNRIRWQTHRYVLRQSLGFFQNDFAGRVANKVMQAAPALRESVVQVIDSIWYAGVQWLGAAVIFASADWRLLIPLLIWLAAYIGALFVFVPRIKERSTEAAEARSMLVGRIVDSYTNILTAKLFAHAEREDAYARTALSEQMSKWQASLRVQTAMELVLYSLNGLLIAGATGVALWLWSRSLVTVGDIAVVTGLVMRIVAMSGWILW
ncbi:MAG: alpha/beta fold hydrolase, partial [Rhodomicrobium sp.]|nr:alpha/beta fold hydrolase [Rhodomicrobium sp.]